MSKFDTTETSATPPLCAQVETDIGDVKTPSEDRPMASCLDVRKLIGRLRSTAEAQVPCCQRSCLSFHKGQWYYKAIVYARQFTAVTVDLLATGFDAKGNAGEVVSFMHDNGRIYSIASAMKRATTSAIRAELWGYPAWPKSNGRVAIGGGWVCRYPTGWTILPMIELAVVDFTDDDLIGTRPLEAMEQNDHRQARPRPSHVS